MVDALGRADAGALSKAVHTQHQCGQGLREAASTPRGCLPAVFAVTYQDRQSAAALARVHEHLLVAATRVAGQQRRTASVT
eukprot:364569-Chlamydomonas_euryale.AAC.10